MNNQIIEKHFDHIINNVNKIKDTNLLILYFEKLSKYKNINFNYLLDNFIKYMEIKKL